MKACSSRLGLTLGVGCRPVRKERGDGREREGGREEGGREGEFRKARDGRADLGDASQPLLLGEEKIADGR